MINRELLISSSAQQGFTISNEVADRLDKYASLLVEWNEKVNLTAITEPDEIAIKHFVDSLLLLNHIKPDASLIDVGTGAGFPSLPCKIYSDTLKLTMLDSLNKRINFLNEVCGELGVVSTNIHARAEEAGQTAICREKYDVATARAVAHLRELSEYCLPFVKVGGLFVALKGYEIEQELDEAQNAITTLGGKVKEVAKYELTGGNKRAIVVIEKVKPTPQEYPRNKGRMNKKPL